MANMLERYAFTPERLKPKSEKEPPRKQLPDVELKWVFQAACWVWGAYSSHTRRQAQDEESVLRAARENYGWLRESQLLEAVNYSAGRAREAAQRLQASGQMVEVKDLYIFPTFLPPTHNCAHCDTMWMEGETHECHNCGAPLHALEGGKT